MLYSPLEDTANMREASSVLSDPRTDTVFFCLKKGKSSCRLVGITFPFLRRYLCFPGLLRLGCWDAPGEQSRSRCQVPAPLPGSTLPQARPRGSPVGTPARHGPSSCRPQELPSLRSPPGRPPPLLPPGAGASGQRLLATARPKAGWEPAPARGRPAPLRAGPPRAAGETLARAHPLPGGG